MAEHQPKDSKPAPPAMPNRGPFAGMGGGPPQKAKDFKGAMRRMLVQLRPDRAGALAVIALSVASVALGINGPRVLGQATDVVFVALMSHRAIDFDAVGRVLVEVMVLYAGASLFAWLQGMLLNVIVQRTMRRMRNDVEAKLNRLPLAYFDTQARGDLLSRVTNDLDNVGQALQQSLSQILNAVLNLVGILIMFFVLSPLLALITIVSVPLSVFSIAKIAGRAQKRFGAQWKHVGQLNAQIEETFTGHSLVKVFGRQKEVETRFAGKNEELYDASFRAQLISSLIMPIVQFIGNLTYVAIAVIGGLRVSSGAMLLGSVQAFTQYARQFSQQMNQVAGMANVLQSGVASAERVFELMDAQEQSPDVSPPADLVMPVRGEVAFEDVSFRYKPDVPLIDGLSLVAKPGQTIAIVGPTGAGKTTLVNLLMRFYELDGGRITLDGVDIAKVPRAALRENIGMVLQDTWLFAGTIRDNLRYGRLAASDDEVLAAARAAYVDRFVQHLPEGYDTKIDDEGTNVSSGEKQLLTIARAFLVDPAILILDEATSSVDTRTEVLVQQAMAALRKERTSFVIAHRLSTIRDADLILVMENGQIVEQGSHTELLARGGAYHKLYSAQFAPAAAAGDQGDPSKMVPPVPTTRIASGDAP